MLSLFHIILFDSVASFSLNCYGIPFLFLYVIFRLGEEEGVPQLQDAILASKQYAVSLIS